MDDIVWRLSGPIFGTAKVRYQPTVEIQVQTFLRPRWKKIAALSAGHCEIWIQVMALASVQLYKVSEFRGMVTFGQGMKSVELRDLLI